MNELCQDHPEKAQAQSTTAAKQIHTRQIHANLAAMTLLTTVPIQLQQCQSLLQTLFAAF